ncbi:tropomyosin-2 [Cystobasidiomycetes sp. EMM_F5]
MRLAALRVEADTNATRAEEAEAKVKKLDHDILTKDQEIQSLQHKLSVAEADLEKLESSLKEHKSAKEEAGQHRDTNESLTRKISLLEEELDTAEKNLRETTDKLRQVDVKAEHFERQVTRAEQERDQWEHKFEEAQAKFLASKKELDELAGQLDSL